MSVRDLQLTLNFDFKSDSDGVRVGIEILKRYFSDSESEFENKSESELQSESKKYDSAGL